MPFLNYSFRKHAGEIISLQFVRALSKIGNFRLIEPGVVRQSLLQSRIVMYDGISLSNASAVFSRLNVDFVLAGRILDYEDYQGPSGKPRVSFSARLIERDSLQIYWLARSYHEGDQGVFFFDWGKIKTAHKLANHMVQLAVEDMFE